MSGTGTPYGANEPPGPENSYFLQPIIYKKKKNFCCKLKQEGKCTFTNSFSGSKDSTSL